MKMNKKGLSVIVATLLIIVLTLTAVGIIWVVIDNVINGTKGEKIYDDCLQNFANEYCYSLNYSKANFWGDGLNKNMYFKCGSERDYLGHGEFINTEEEKDYCKKLMENSND